MIAAEALSHLSNRLAEGLQSPVELGEGDMGAGPGLRILIHSMSAVPDVSKMTGRHVADQTASMSWVFLLILKGEAESQLAAIRLVEATAGNIDARPVLGGEGWRADMALEDAPEWARGMGAAIGLRLRVTNA